MVLAGSPFAHEIDFGTGLPTGAVVYSLLGNNNLPLAGYDSLSVTPAAGALSLMIILPGATSTVATPLFETRTLTWSYMTANGLVTGRERYRVERDIVFPVSPDGVRRKLGVEDHEVGDKDIDLLLGYANLASLYANNALTVYATSGDRNTLLVTDAIEAMAALNVIDTLQLSVARRESSGTNTYERFSNMDWEALRASLSRYLSPINDLLTPLIDVADVPIIFFAVNRPDPLTGATT